MRNAFVALLFLSLVLSSVDALPPRIVRVPEEPAPATDGAAPAPPRRSLFDRIFGPEPPPTPPPAVAPTPPPKRRIRKPARQVQKVEKPAQPDSATQEPAPVVPKPVRQKVKTAGRKPEAGAKPDLTGLDDAAKFKVVREKAMEDPELKELKSKADGEVDEAEAHKALAAYNRALFRKIREIDPGLGDYSEKVEASMQRRLSAEKGRP